MNSSTTDFSKLAQDIRAWSIELGFDEVGITNTELSEHETHLMNWLAAGYQGEMQYMDKHGTKRSQPEKLIPGTIRIISTRINYQTPDAADEEDVLNNHELAYISRYALGRDYHKVIRKRLQKLADKIAKEVGPFGYRAFVDSAPVLEKALAEKAGLGWIGKHTNLINRECGSWFFLGELYTDLPLPIDSPVENHCGTCNKCIEICPTQAIIAPYKLDARRCISYHTIELRESIPIEFRKAMGNRIYGCDDCQLYCPWNRFEQKSELADFAVRNNLDAPELISLFSWSEEEFLKNTEGSAIRRIGYECWLRNIAVALGNAPSSSKINTALQEKQSHPSELVREHVAWAIEQHHLN
ncbi:MAG: tRNA epoxyqueuosine(34) reductase QueG [Gammaproteobacteria bacterium]|nr:MAG: tRNA epoxyqueuosine(34) reductase QueG [Gammaproteobacteria bacterium]